MGALRARLGRPELAQTHGGHRTLVHRFIQHLLTSVGQVADESGQSPSRSFIKPVRGKLHQRSRPIFPRAPSRGHKEKHKDLFTGFLHPTGRLNRARCDTHGFLCGSLIRQDLGRLTLVGLLSKARPANRSRELRNSPRTGLGFEWRRFSTAVRTVWPRSALQRRSSCWSVSCGGLSNRPGLFHYGCRCREGPAGSFLA